MKLQNTPIAIEGPGSDQWGEGAAKKYKIYHLNTLINIIVPT